MIKTKKMIRMSVKSFIKTNIGFDDVDLSINYIDGRCIFNQEEIKDTTEIVSELVETKIKNREWFGGISDRQTEIEYSDDLLHKRSFINVFCNNAELMVVLDFIEI